MVKVIYYLIHLLFHVKDLYLILLFIYSILMNYEKFFRKLVIKHEVLFNQVVYLYESLILSMKIKSIYLLLQILLPSLLQHILIVLYLVHIFNVVYQHRKYVKDESLKDHNTEYFRKMDPYFFFIYMVGRGEI